MRAISGCGCWHASSGTISLGPVLSPQAQVVAVIRAPGFAALHWAFSVYCGGSGPPKEISRAVEPRVKPAIVPTKLFGSREKDKASPGRLETQLGRQRLAD